MFKSRSLAEVRPLESRTMLTVSLLESYGSLQMQMHASSDAIYLSGWSSDGSLAGEHGSIDHAKFAEYVPWNGGLLGRGAGNNAAPLLFTVNREAGLQSLEGAAGIAQHLFAAPPLTIGKLSYFSGGNRLLRATGSALSTAVTLQSFGSDALITSFARLGSTKRFAFTVFDDRRGSVQLWLSDGTTSGTTLFSGASNDELAAAGSYVYFAKSDANKGSELWRTDGTTAGTTRVADLRHGAEGSAPIISGAIGARVLFIANDGGGPALWGSDGTASGTQRLSTTVSHFSVPIRYAGGKAFFLDNNNDPWVTDGTTSGTHAIRDWVPGYLDQSFDRHLSAVMVGAFYFTAQTSSQRAVLWRSDGTNAGTRQVADLSTAFPDDNSFGHEMVAFNGAIYLQASNGTVGNGVWRISDSNITLAGEAFDDADADLAPDPGEAALANVRIYIDANNNSAFDTGEQSVLTDSRGRYAFSGLSAGLVRVRQVTPSGKRATSPDYAANLVAGDHVIKAFGSTSASEARLAGDVSTANGAISGFIVYLDTNANGRREKTEPATTTDITGRYVFHDLAPNIYTVRLVGQDGWIAERASGKRVRVKAHQTATADFTRRAGSIFKVSAFNDVDGDGVRDKGESLFSAKSMSIDMLAGDQGQDPNINATSTSIDENGAFVFTLGTSSYLAPTVTIDGWRQTFADEYFRANAVDLVAGQVATLTVSMTRDALIIPQIFRDRNSNGRCDEDNDEFFGSLGAGDSAAIDVNHDGRFNDTDTELLLAKNGGLAAGTYRVRITTSKHLTSPAEQSITVKSGELRRVLLGYT